MEVLIELFTAALAGLLGKRKRKRNRGRDNERR